jgi:hypothetical protein
MADIVVRDILVSDSETASVIDVVLEREVSVETRRKINEAVGDYIQEQTLLYLADAKSPVSGERFSSLNSEYAKLKSEAGGTPIANLEATGNMLQSLNVDASEDGIIIGVFGGEAPKADGHNNLSGQSELPQRRFLPDVGQKYKREILNGAKEIINDILADDVPISSDDLAGVESTAALYDVLGEAFGLTSRAAISRAVLANDKLREMLAELDLLDLL